MNLISTGRGKYLCQPTPSMETFICLDRRHGEVLDVLNVGALEAFARLTDAERIECREVWLATELLKALLPQSQLTDLQVLLA